MNPIRPSASDLNKTFAMIISKQNRRAIYENLFKGAPNVI